MRRERERKRGYSVTGVTRARRVKLDGENPGRGRMKFFVKRGEEECVTLSGSEDVQVSKLMLFNFGCVRVGKFEGNLEARAVYFLYLIYRMG